MRNTGITRRIDELGRIVIPKELRKSMHLKSGELLEIFLSDKDTLSLRKYSQLSNSEEFINVFIKMLGKKINCNIYVTDLDKVIFSTKEEFINKKISLALEEQIKNNSILNGLKKVTLFDDYVIEDNFKINQILPNGDLFGAIIFEFFENKESNNDICNFYSDFLKEYLESY